MANEITHSRWVCRCLHSFELHTVPDVKMPLYVILEVYGGGHCSVCKTCGRFEQIENLEYVDYVNNEKKNV